MFQECWDYRCVQLHPACHVSSRDGTQVVRCVLQAPLPMSHLTGLQRHFLRDTQGRVPTENSSCDPLRDFTSVESCSVQRSCLQLVTKDLFMKNNCSRQNDVCNIVIDIYQKYKLVICVVEWPSQGQGISANIT